MKTLTRALSVLLIGLGLAVPLAAQTVLTSTTLSTAITDTAGTSMVVASATGFTAPGTGANLVYALIDREIVAVRTVSSTTIGIARGQLSTRAATHLSGATVWKTLANSGAINSYIPSGQCTRTTLLAVPWIVGGSPGLGSEVGTLWDCLGVTTGGQWVQTNGQSALAVLGSTVASATSVTPTGTYFKMSGTVNPVSTIVVPAGTAPGFCLQIEPTAAWVTDTGGNILIASTAVTGKVMTQCWNGAKWAPSY